MFDKEYTQKWSGEIFTVINRKLNQNIAMYELNDYNNDVIEGFFYEPELQLGYIDSDIIYKFEEILKKGKGGGGGVEVLVKWKGWPSKFNSWILEKDVQNL